MRRPDERPPERSGPGFWRPFGIVVAAWFTFGILSTAVSGLGHYQDPVFAAWSGVLLAVVALLAFLAPRWVLRVDPPEGSMVRFRTLFRVVSVPIQDIHSVQVGHGGTISLRHARGRLYLGRRTQGWAEAVAEVRRVNPDLVVGTRSTAWAAIEEAAWSLPFGALVALAFASAHAPLTAGVIGAMVALLRFGIGMSQWRRDWRMGVAVAASGKGQPFPRLRTPRTWWVLPTSVGATVGTGWAAVNWFIGSPSHSPVDTFLAFVAAGSSTFVWTLALVWVWRRLSGNGRSGDVIP
jgi:hypothetical protein